MKNRIKIRAGEIFLPDPFPDKKYKYCRFSVKLFESLDKSKVAAVLYVLL